MTLIAQRNVTGEIVRPNVMLPGCDGDLAWLVTQHADQARPFIVSVHRLGEPLAPADTTVVLRSEMAGRVVGADEAVIITYLPQGGGSGGGSSILMAVAAIALMVIAPYAVAALGVPALGTSAGALTLGGKLLATGIVMGGMALLSSAMKPKANQTEQEDREIYGVSGGGNLPRPGDRIPRLYGRCWTTPDLSQPDYFVYEGEHQILYKRMTLTLGGASVHKVRVSGQLMWTEAGGIRAPFEGSQVEIVNPGETCRLVPRDVVSSESVQGNELIRPDSDVGEWTGPFIVSGVGVEINKIQLDISAPQGSGLNFANSQGAMEAGAPLGWEFEYAAIDDAGNRTGSWKRLDKWSNTVLSRRPLRYTRMISVPEGRYMVRGRNLFDNKPRNFRETNIANALQWDGLRGHRPEKRVRDHVTEIAIKVKSSAALGITSFADVEVEATGRVPVWNGSTWETRATRLAVWAFADIMRNTVYGAAIPASALDVETLRFYADEDDEIDALGTFDGVIRGPDSVCNVASAVLFPMRAEPVQLGRIWSMVRDDRKDMRRHVITARQIVRGSSGLSFDVDPDRGDAHIVAEYDEDGDPRRPIQLPDIYYGNKSITPTRRKLFGVTSWNHAQHLARWLALVASYRRQTVRFQTEHDGRIYKRGDSIAVETWFASNAKLAGVVGVSGQTLTFDRDVPFASGDHLIIRDRSGREWGPVALTGQGGGLNQLVMDAASQAAVEADTGLPITSVLALDIMETSTALVAGVSTLTRNFIVKSAKPNGRDRIDIEAVIDRQAVWSRLGEEVIPDPYSTDDPPDPTPPGNLTTLERLSIGADGEVRSTFVVAWQRTSQRALLHEVQYRIDYRLPTVDATDADTVAEETATDGQWIPAGATDGQFLKIENLPPSQVDIRARAVYSAQAVSAWVQLNDILATGVLAPPSDVAGLTASVRGEVMTLAWIGVTDVHLSHYEIRFSPQLSGVTWGTSVPLLERVPVAGAQVPAASGTYLVKAITRAGVPSANAAVVVSDVVGVANMNAIESFVEQPAFAGAPSKVIRNDTLGGLQLAYAGDVFARDDWFGPPDWFLGEEGIESEGIYGFGQSLDLGAVYTSRVSGVIEAQGAKLTSDFFALEDVFAVEDFFLTGSASTWGVVFEARTTNDDPAGAPVWSDWRPVVIGDVTAQAFEFRLRLLSYEHGVTPLVTRLEALIDMPDRQEGGNDLAVPAAGLRVDFVPPFRGLKGLGITAQGLTTGDTWTVTNKSEEGFDIRFFNASGTAVARSLDFVATGYGRKET
ncbi:host specificity factor TipJ family phage tail protein [Microvirga roseola]|uniref:host specificity factor TipJ family phage tail protein n=1 Tax=Microvirga roseola TaxID=2883126 RepID=UPI001E4C474D|nr:host specificity factor TipJ family phage tail protein [Microvirga roseola]